MDCREPMTAMSTRRSFVSASAATLASTQLPPMNQSDRHVVYIGSTDNKNSGDGIHAAFWNPEMRTLSNLRQVVPVVSAGFLATGKLGNLKVLYAGHEATPKVGGLSSYEIQPSGDLTLINTVTTPDFDMVHLAVTTATARSLPRATAAARSFRRRSLLTGDSRTPSR